MYVDGGVCRHWRRSLSSNRTVMFSTMCCPCVRAAALDMYPIYACYEHTLATRRVVYLAVITACCHECLLPTLGGGGIKLSMAFIIKQVVSPGDDESYTKSAKRRISSDYTGNTPGHVETTAGHLFCGTFSCSHRRNVRPILDGT